MADSFHKRCRAEVAAALRAALETAGFEVPVHERDVPDLALVDKPCVVVSYAGREYPTGGVTNLRKDWGFPLLLGLYTLRPDSPDADPPGGDLTLYRETVRDAFDDRRVAALPEVMWCEYDGDPQIVMDALPAFKDLRTAATVTPVARLARGS